MSKGPVSFPRLPPPSSLSLSLSLSLSPCFAECLKSQKILPNDHW
jgi:hypothetical protein